MKEITQGGADFGLVWDLWSLQLDAMREAEEKSKQKVEIKEFEGFLSQQGGDCPVSTPEFFLHGIS